MHQLKKIVTLCVILFCTIIPLSSAVDPSWYVVSMLAYNDGLYNNTQDLNWTSNISNYLAFGQVETRRNNWTAAYTADYTDLTVRFSTPESMQLINVDDHSKRFDFSLKIENTGAVQNILYITEPNHSYPVKAGLSHSTVSKFFLMINPQPLADDSYRGTYAAPLYFEVFDKDGDLLASKLYTIIMYYRSKSRPGNQAVHLLLVEHFPTATGIDVTYLMQHPFNTLYVGAVTFISTDWKQNTTYRIDITPLPSIGPTFQFKREGGTETIPYSVTTSKDPTTMHTSGFPVPITNRASTGYWQERIEIGIKNVNPANTPLKGGDYSSTIVISLYQN